MLDAYIRKSQIPPHLTTVEFFQLVRQRLGRDGLFVANLTGSKAFLARVTKTIEIAFPGSLFWTIEGTSNIVSLSSVARNLDRRISASSSPRLNVDTRKYDVDFLALINSQHWSVSADASEALTDDFAPTEYLNQE